MSFSFELVHKDKKTDARAGRIFTEHGVFDTPVFMPVGTQGTVKTMASEELEKIGIGIVLANTYHLSLRPGESIIEKAGGLHKFMHWSHSILTDSGGYQIFSLAKLRRITDEGVEFHSHFDGSVHFFTPEDIIRIQEILGADIIMPLDECTEYPCSYEYAKSSAEMTLRWAERSRKAHNKDCQALFGITQGNFYPDLRRESCKRLLELDFSGYAIGGLSVGENRKMRLEMVECIIPFLPGDKPRYLMGVGEPEDILLSVEKGVDMFDCVLPTRNARNGSILTWEGRVSIRNRAFRESFLPVDGNCNCYTCSNYTAAYLHHLFRSGEILALRLNTWHNLFFMNSFMQRMRESIIGDTFLDFKRDFFTNREKSDQVLGGKI